jgi:hypothetical protein
MIVESLVVEERGNGRAGCRHFGLPRSTFFYQAKEPTPWLSASKADLRRVSNQHMEIACAKITRILKGHEWNVGTRLVGRFRRATWLACPREKARTS